MGKTRGERHTSDNQKLSVNKAVDLRHIQRNRNLKETRGPTQQTHSDAPGKKTVKEEKPTYKKKKTTHRTQKTQKKKEDSNKHKEHKKKKKKKKKNGKKKKKTNNKKDVPHTHKHPHPGPTSNIKPKRRSPPQDTPTHQHPGRNGAFIGQARDGLHAPSRGTWRIRSKSSLPKIRSLQPPRALARRPTRPMKAGPSDHRQNCASLSWALCQRSTNTTSIQRKIKERRGTNQCIGSTRQTERKRTDNLIAAHALSTFTGLRLAGVAFWNPRFAPRTHDVEPQARPTRHNPQRAKTEYCPRSVSGLRQDGVSCRESLRVTFGERYRQVF